MKKGFKFLIIIVALIIALCVAVGCTNATSVVSIEKTGTSGLVDTYTITYSDGKTSTFTITNGRDGTNGTDGETVDLEDVYAKYLEEYPIADYQSFLQSVMTVNVGANTQVIGKALLSSAKVYTEFTEKYRVGSIWSSREAKETAVYLGSAIIYKVNSDYTYFITNFHVIYDVSSIDENKISKKITVYLYGSEGTPAATNQKDANGCTVYDYGSYAIDCEYVGGSANSDIAIIRAETASVKKINPDVIAIEFADSYHVGDTAIAIGNPEGEGLSVTSGIVSVDNEYITLSVDGTTRSHRSIRMDTAIYHGSSGGGLFDVDGKLIGVTNAGNEEDQNVNYAIPVDIVRATVENIMYYVQKGEKNVRRISLGITVTSENSRYVYDKSTGYGTIVEDVMIANVGSGSIAEKMGIAIGDRISELIVNEEHYTLNRSFNIGDILLIIRENDVISLVYERDGATNTTSTYTVKAEDILKIA